MWPGALAREWIDGVNVLVDGAGASAGLAIQQIAREKKPIKLLSEVKHKWDLFKLISTVPTPNAYAPAGTFGCSLGTA
jgi:hypothetical protein